MLPKMLCPTQLITCRLRAANIGASALLSSVSPVLPSCPIWQVSRSIASSQIAAGALPSEGVKLTYGWPSSSANRIQRAGGKRKLARLVEQLRQVLPLLRQSRFIGRRLGGSKVDDDELIEVVLLDEVLEVGLDSFDCGA